MLTKPLSKIIEHLVSINPDRPSQHQLPLLKGHERNELGLWVTTANQLLASIESNSHLRREAEDNLLRISQYDFLTGLPNRQLLQQQLDQILDGAGRQQRRVAVLCLGLDDFKGINEQYTYQLGDQLLIALADRLRGHSARLGSLARLGGDQFALVRPTSSNPTRRPNWRRASSTAWKRRSRSTSTRCACAPPSVSPCSPRTARPRRNCCRRPSRP